MTHEEKIKKMAEKWYDANSAMRIEKERVEKATSDYDAAARGAENIRKELADCVGQNIPRRYISMANGQIVVVTYHKERVNTVTVADVIR